MYNNNVVLIDFTGVFISCTLRTLKVASVHKRGTLRHALARTFLLALSGSFKPAIRFIPELFAQQVMEIGPQSVNSVSDLNVVATISNVGEETLKVLSHPHSPLSSDLPANIFQIRRTDTGAQPSFMGARVKYVAEKAAVSQKGYVTLDPGQNVTVQHNRTQNPSQCMAWSKTWPNYLVGLAYNFTVSGEGQYNITANSLFHIIQPNSSILLFQAVQDPDYVTTISGNLALTRRSSDMTKLRLSRILPGGKHRRRDNPTFASCTPEQQNAINEAIPVTQQYVSDAYAYLSTLPIPGTTLPLNVSRSDSNSTDDNNRPHIPESIFNYTVISPGNRLPGPNPPARRYITWFGEYQRESNITTSRLDTVTRHFSAIHATDFPGLNYNCSCERDDIFAYVYPNQ